ncbi:MAG: metalloregulator ArsR/SmtB family transcription factor [Promethearchaeia archaeon]
MKKERRREIIDSLKGCEGLGDVDLDEYCQTLQNRGNSITKQQNFQKILKMCNALGNEERLKILGIIKEKECCVCELEAALNKSQSTISHHLRVLEKIGVIEGIRKGRFTHYAMRKEKFRNYMDLLQHFLEL